MQPFEEACAYICKPITGIIHVGSHDIEEHAVYTELFRQPLDNLLYIDIIPPSDDALKALNLKLGEDVRFVEACCGDTDTDDALVYFSNYSQCIGLLPFSDKHKETFTTILQQSEMYPMKKLDTLINKTDKKLRNTLTISVNGGELKVLKGAETLLEFIDFVFVRFETLDFHVGAPSKHELNDWMGMNGFKEATRVKCNEHSELVLYISLDAQHEQRRREKEMTDALQLFVEEYNRDNNKHIVTQVYHDEE